MPSDPRRRRSLRWLVAVVGAGCAGLSIGCATPKLQSFSEVANGSQSLRTLAGRVATQARAVELRYQIVDALRIETIDRDTFRRRPELRDWAELRDVGLSLLVDYFRILDAWWGVSPKLPERFFLDPVDDRGRAIANHLDEMRLELRRLESNPAYRGTTLGIQLLTAGKGLVGAVEVRVAELRTRLQRGPERLENMMKEAEPSLARLCGALAMQETSTREVLDGRIDSLIYQLNEGRPSAYSGERRLRYDEQAAGVLVPATATLENLDLVRDALENVPSAHRSLLRLLDRAGDERWGSMDEVAAAPAELVEPIRRFLIPVRHLERRELEGDK